MLPSRFVLAQGISSRGLKPKPRGKPSGRPFLAHFTDIAKKAGLTARIICGGISKDYIIEVVGAGVAFIDYDNDGWMDLFVLNGTKLEGDPPGVTNRLYKNNRDGTFTDVTRKQGCFEPAGPRVSPSRITTTTGMRTCLSLAAVTTFFIATTAMAPSPT